MRQDDGRSRKRKRLLEQDWPSADQSLWGAAFAHGDVFDDGGAGIHLATKTRFCLIYACGRWLAHLANTDPEGLLERPLCRATHARVREFALALANTNTPRSTATILRQLRQALRILGSRDALPWITAMASRLEASCQPRAKHHRLRASDELFSFGMELMEQAEGIIHQDRKASILEAQLYRDGLLIAILAAVPLRRRNAASLTLGRNIVRIGPEWLICLSAAETKNGRSYEGSLGRLSSNIDRFIEAFRPIFNNSVGHRGLWPSVKGVPMSGNAIYDAICRRTAAHFGRPVNPHLFRDGAATFWALEAPEAIEQASALLGHADLKTFKHYNQARSIAAGRRVAAVLRKAARFPTRTA